ncbi:unnamed protein product [Lampetra planeri]
MSGGDRSLRLLPGLHSEGHCLQGVAHRGGSRKQWCPLEEVVAAVRGWTGTSGIISQQPRGWEPRETPTEGAGDPVDRPVITEPTTRDPMDHPTPIGRIQEDVGCAFPGLDDEQLRRTQQRDLDLAAVEAALWEKKSTLPEPRSSSYVRRECFPAAQRGTATGPQSHARN